MKLFYHILHLKSYLCRQVLQQAFFLEKFSRVIVFKENKAHKLRVDI